jgi:methylmalonyl-CoA/ethylmalonyl-CoA epimerase
MRKIEHIGIAVKDLEVSNTLFEKLFGAPAYKSEVVESEGVTTSFFLNGPNKIELLAATNPESPIAKFIEKKGEGIHHIAFDVEDLVSEIARLQNEGFVVLNVC